MNGLVNIAGTWIWYVICVAVLILFVGSLAVLFSFLMDKRRVAPVIIVLLNLLMTGVVIVVLMDCGHYMHVTNTDAYKAFQTVMFEVPYQIYLMVELISCVALFAMAIEGAKYRTDNVTPDSIQQAIDALPDGISISSKDGIVRLSNLKINTLSRALTGKVLTNAELFWDAVIKNGKEQGGSYLVDLQDNEVWLFTKEDIDIDGTDYDQITSMNVITIGNDVTSVSFSGDAMGLFTLSNLILGDKLIIKSPENGKLNTAGNCIIGSDGNAAKTVTLVPQTVSTTYPVWVGDTQVTSVNKDDILGDGGKAKYYPDSKTLVFDDPTISSYGLYGSNVYFEQDINIEGTLTITGGQFGIIDDGYKHNITINGDINVDVLNDAIAAKDIEIKGGKVNLNSQKSNAIIGQNITISGGYVNAATSSTTSYAIVSAGGGDIVISGGTVTATSASQYTINSLEGKVIIANGASRVEAKGTGEAISADKGIEIGEVLNITTPADGIISSDGKFVAESDGTTPADHVVIERDPAKFPVTVVITTWDKDNNCISEVGGTVTGAPTVTKKGDTIEVAVTPKDGYEIVEISFGDGLISTQTGMSTKFTVPADYTPLTDTVQIDVLFRAKAATPSYTVTFNTDGGSTVAAQTVTSGARPQSLLIPLRKDSLLMAGIRMLHSQQLSTSILRLLPTSRSMRSGMLLLRFTTQL